MTPVTAKKLLKDIGISANGKFPTEAEFPKLFKVEFQQLYAEFLETVFAQRLWDMEKDPNVSKLNVIHGFISYTVNYTSAMFKSPYNLNKISSYALLEQIKTVRRTHLEKFRLWNILREFSAVEARVHLESKVHDREVNYLQGFSGYVEYYFVLGKQWKVGRDEQDGRYKYNKNSVVGALHRLKPYMFKKGIPPELLPKSNFKRERYPLVGDVRKKPIRSFAELDRGVYAHLAGKNSLLVRFALTDLDTAALFLGTQPKTFLQTVQKSAAQLF